MKITTNMAKYFAILLSVLLINTPALFAADAVVEALVVDVNQVDSKANANSAKIDNANAGAKATQEQLAATQSQLDALTTQVGTIVLTPGADGTDGTDGADGTNGIDGTNGLDGADGVLGFYSIEVLNKRDDDPNAKPPFFGHFATTAWCNPGDKVISGSAITGWGEVEGYVLHSLPTSDGSREGWKTFNLSTEGGWYNILVHAMCADMP